MSAVMWGKLRQFLRKPGGIIITTIICIAFALVTGSSANEKIEVSVFHSMEQKEVNTILQKLNQSDTFHFVEESEEKVKNKVAEGKSEVGIELKRNEYTLYYAGETQNVSLIDHYVSRYYEKKLQQSALNELSGKNGKTKIDPVFKLKISSFNDSKPVYNQKLHSIFGFTLFFVIYTVAFTVVEILRDKQNGIWDRLILSSTAKSKLYLGNLLYSFLVSYVQMIFIFLVFRFVVGVDFNGRFLFVLLAVIPYLFAIVSLCILLTGLVKTMGQYNAIIPLVSVSFAMLGGAYWPLEIVSSDMLINMSKVIPLTYGMEILNGIVLGGLSFSDLLLPIAVLLLMGVLMMGIGIRLIEKRHV